MRGEPERQMPLFHVFEVEDRIRPDHPLRNIKRRTDRILASLDDQFAKAYSHTVRPSMPLERLLKAMLLMCLYSFRSEQQLCEQIDVNLLYRWFLDMHPSDEAFDTTVFSKNCGHRVIPLHVSRHHRHDRGDNADAANDDPFALHATLPFFVNPVTQDHSSLKV